MNTYLGKPMDTTWQQTAEDFATFMRELQRVGRNDSMNGHFQTSLRVTDYHTFQYEYFLRLEDMGQWLPCMAHVRMSLALFSFFSSLAWQGD